MACVKADKMRYLIVELLEIFKKIANFSATPRVFGKQCLAAFCAQICRLFGGFSCGKTNRLFIFSTKFF